MTEQRDFDSLFRSEFPGIVRDIDFIVGDHELALELAQEAFIRAHLKWRAVSRYDHPRAWIRTVGVRLGMRSNKRRSALDRILARHNEEARQPEPTQMVIDVRRAVMSLPPVQRATVVLHYFHDIPLKEVAKTLHCKEATARVNVHKAREQLRTLLADYGSD